jgi:translation elongation factor EF-Ts
VTNGFVYAHNDSNGRLVSVVELKCKTEHVAKSAEFKKFAHDLALHVAQSNAVNLVMLMLEKMHTDPKHTVLYNLAELSKRFDENCVIGRYIKWELGK